MGVTQYNTTNYHIRLAIQKITNEIAAAVKKRPDTVTCKFLDIITFTDREDTGGSKVIDIENENLDIDTYDDAIQFFESNPDKYEILNASYPVIVVCDLEKNNYISVEEYEIEKYCVDGYYPNYTNDELVELQKCINTLDEATNAIDEVKSIILKNK